MPRPYKNLRTFIKSQLIPLFIDSQIQQYKKPILIEQIRYGQVKNYKLFDIPKTRLVKKQELITANNYGIDRA